MPWHLSGHLSGRAPALALALMLGLATPAAGESEPGIDADGRPDSPLDLVVHRLPGQGQIPTTLDMRSTQIGLALAQVNNRTDPALAPAPDVSPEPSSDPESDRPIPLTRAERTRRAERAVFGQKPLSDRVIFRVNVGYGIDGGERVAESGLDLNNYAQLRTYYYGDVVLGSRGLVSPSLSTYFASQFRFDETLSTTTSTPIPSLHYAERMGLPVPDLWYRSGYATWQGVGGIRALEPLYIRAGRQYRYGPAIAHFDGLTIGYEGDAWSFGGFTGQAVDVTGLPISDLYRETGVISGLDGRLDLYRINGAPLVITGELLRFDATTHLNGTLALRINQDIALRASMRSRDGEIARTGIHLHARIRPVSLVDVRIESRSEHDWMYDLFASDDNDNDSNAREDSLFRYFRLGKTLPRLYFTARAGTVLLRNVDVLLHGRGALRQSEDDERSPHSTSFAQAGGAVEVRVRRSVNLGIGLLARRYWRLEPSAEDSAEQPDPLITDTDAVGERSFAEGNATVRYSQGARKFSAGAELYVRGYNFQSSYVWDVDSEDLPERLRELELRAGGRFSIEGLGRRQPASESRIRPHH